MVHDTGTGSEDNVSELTSRKELDNPLLQIGQLDVVAGVDATALVDTITRKRNDTLYSKRPHIPSIELNHNLAVTMVINFFKLSNVT